MNIDISVIIVNYNSGEITKKCIDSVLIQKGNNYEVIVVDNASVDKSIEIFKQYDKQIKLIENEKNIGFGGANNQAAQQAKGRYICMLNPDAEFEKHDALETLTDYMDKHPEFGLIGSPLIDDTGKITCFEKKTYPGENHIKHRFDHLPGEIAWVLGALMFVRQDAFEKIQGFDKDYFVYGEDADLCLRLRQAGYEIGYCEDVHIKHLGSITTVNKYYYDVKTRKENGLYIFYRKHFEPKDVRYFELKEVSFYFWHRFLFFS